MPSLAIKLPDNNRIVGQIRQRQWVALHGRPQQVAIPGGVVALVGAGGRVRLVGRARKIVGPLPIRLLNGDMRENGYRLELVKVRVPPKELRLKINWYAVGQFRYFDARSWGAIILGGLESIGNRDYLEALGETHTNNLSQIAFAGGIPGQSKGAPEAKLVREYVAWLRAEHEFGHTFLRAGRLFVDLFDTRYWRLIEAKHVADRRNLRAAVGQLLDYKRWYPRKPSLGVLVSSKPSDSCRRFLNHYDITVIWRTPSGRFADSSQDGRWSTNRRATIQTP